jgi:hypothetical protein
LRYIGAIFTCSQSLVCVLREHNKLDTLFNREHRKNLVLIIRPQLGLPDFLNDGRPSWSPSASNAALSSSDIEFCACMDGASSPSSSSASLGSLYVATKTPAPTKPGYEP